MTAPAFEDLRAYEDETCAACGGRILPGSADVTLHWDRPTGAAEAAWSHGGLCGELVEARRDASGLLPRQKGLRCGAVSDDETRVCSKPDSSHGGAHRFTGRPRWAGVTR